MTDKITLGNLVNLTNQTAAITTINNNNALLTTAINNTLSRDGTPPNQMTAALDMSSNRILNLPTPISATEPLRYIDGVTAGLVGPQGPQGIPGTPGTGTVNSITGGTGIAVTGTASVPIVTNTGVTSVTAGSGITIAGTTTPTITNNGVTSVTAGTGVAITGTPNAPIVSVSTTGGRVNGPNLLPNTNWQLHSILPGSLSSTTAFNQAGNGFQNQVNVSSFTTTNNQPTFFTANTQQLQNGSIVTFGSGLGGLSGYGLRVIGLVPNTSFLCQLPFGAVSPASSSAITAFPQGASNLGASPTVADGWSKTSSLKYAADQFAVNLCPGAKRVINLCKGIPGNEDFGWTCTQERLPEFLGRTITFGMMVYYKTQTGTPSSKLYISDGITQTLSNPVTGVSYTNPNTAYGHYEFLTVTQQVSMSATGLFMGIHTVGSGGDVLYVATPTCKYGGLMTIDDLGQNYQERIIATAHWNPPCFVPLTTSLPAAQMISGVGLWGWPGLDIEALSLCECHNSVSKIGIQAEYGSSSSGARLFIACMKGDMVPSVPLTFGLECTPFSTNPSLAVAASMNMVPLAIGPSNHASPQGVFTIFGSIASQNVNLTLDFCDVIG